MRPLTLLLAVGALVVTACSTTALSSAPDPTPVSVSVPPLPDEAPEAADEVAPDDTTEPADTDPAADGSADPGDTDTTDTDIIPVDTDTDTDAAAEGTDETDAVDATGDADAIDAVEIAYVRDIRTVEPLDPPLRAVGSSSGAETVRLQERLLELGFWVQATDGNYGLTTRQAVMAFQKYHGLSADGVAGDITAEYLSAATERAHGRADAGSLIEVDKTRQLLFIVIDGQTEWVLNTSTGTEIPYERPNANNPEIIERGSSITPNGLHSVYRSHADGWREGDLGEIYRPRYFIGGVAVHGSNSIPNYAASHGCVRVSVPAMDWIWENDFMPMGSPVWVHGEIPSGRL